MKVIMLVDHKQAFESENIELEHGLSIYFSIGGYNYLFDMGASDKFYHNAVVFGIDLSDVDAAIISHGHADHGGGLKKFLEINKKAKIYVQKDIYQPHYSKHLIHKKKIMLDPALIEQNMDRFVFVSSDIEINRNIRILTKFPAEYALPPTHHDMYTMENHHLEHDDFHHEILVDIHEQGKRILLTGCSHNGILNMIAASEKKHPQPIHAVIGGLQLVGKETKEKQDFINQIIEKIQDFNLHKLYACHCTDDHSYDQLHDKLGEKIDYFAAGKVLEL